MSILPKLLIVHLLALMTPGPDFLIVSRTAIAVSRRAAALTAFGIAVGVMLWAGAALVGLHLILEQNVWIAMAVKALGGAYLIYIGALTLRASATTATESGADASALKDAAAFRLGFLTNLANPKAAIYFASIFATFLDASTSVPMKRAIFALISLESLLWFLLVGTLFSLPPVRRFYLRAQRWIDSVAGIAFVGLGISLLASMSRA